MICICSYGLMSLFSPPGSLDTRLFYSASEAKSYLLSLSSVQRSNYFLNELIDLNLILSYTGLMIIVGTRLKIWTALFYMTGLFDLIETLGIILYLKDLVSIEFIKYFGTVTFLKWLGALVFFLMLLKALLHRPASNSGD